MVPDTENDAHDFHTRALRRLFHMTTPTAQQRWKSSLLSEEPLSCAHELHQSKSHQERLNNQIFQCMSFLLLHHWAPKSSDSCMVLILLPGDVIKSPVLCQKLDVFQK